MSPGDGGSSSRPRGAEGPDDGRGEVTRQRGTRPTKREGQNPIDRKGVGIDRNTNKRGSRDHDTQRAVKPSLLVTRKRPGRGCTRGTSLGRGRRSSDRDYSSGRVHGVRRPLVGSPLPRLGGPRGGLHLGRRPLGSGVVRRRHDNGATAELGLSSTRGFSHRCRSGKRPEVFRVRHVSDHGVPLFGLPKSRSHVPHTLCTCTTSSLPDHTGTTR